MAQWHNARKQTRILARAAMLQGDGLRAVQQDVLNYVLVEDNRHNQHNQISPPNKLSNNLRHVLTMQHGVEALVAVISPRSTVDQSAEGCSVAKMTTESTTASARVPANG